MSAKCPKHRADVCADRINDAEHGERGFRDECLRANPDEADWILMTDVDEFLYFRPSGEFARWSWLCRGLQCWRPF